MIKWQTGTPPKDTPFIGITTDYIFATLMTWNKRDKRFNYCELQASGAPQFEDVWFENEQCMEHTITHWMPMPKVD